jgi:hypothetical protein
MISQEESKGLYECLKDILAKEIKELIENPVLAKKDLDLSNIITRMIKQNTKYLFNYHIINQFRV